MFSHGTFGFLEDLAAHNDKAWFEANKVRYESMVREPALEFIAAMSPALAEFAPHFRADPRKVGGSLMRVFRDTRFSRDKTPYKTNVGIMFKHERGKDVHAPGFYVHLSPEECFLGVGSWHPESELLGRIRDLICEKPDLWISTRDDKTFGNHWSFTGDSLTRPPKGYPTDHACIEDLKRKDFVALAGLSREEVCGRNLTKLATKRFSEAAPFMAFLCAAARIEW